MPLDDLLDNSDFRAGLAAGAVALLVTVVAALIARRIGRSDPGPLPIAGIVLVAAALVAVGRASESVTVGGRLVAGLVLLAIGPLLATLRPSRVTQVLALVPGAVLVASAAGLENDVGWVPAGVFVAIILGGLLVADFDRVNSRSGLGPVLVAVSTLAMYTSLPDTEEIAAVLGAALPLALLGMPRVVASLGRAGACSTIGLLMWVAAVDGRARPGSVVGAMACLGVLVVEPLVRRVAPARWRARPPSAMSLRAILMVLLQFGVVAATSRVAGLETSAFAAGALSAIALTLAAVALAILLRPWGPGDDPPAPPTAPGRRGRAHPTTPTTPD